jgi:hypothetical protein
VFGHPTRAGNYTFTVKARDRCRVDKAQTALKEFRIAVAGTSPCPLLQISTRATLPQGRVGQVSPYKVQIQTTGGQKPLSFSVLFGKLPPGLSLSRSGLLSGRPTQPGNHSFTIKAQDSCSGGQQVESKNFKLAIDPPKGGSKR